MKIRTQLRIQGSLFALLGVAAMGFYLVKDRHITRQRRTTDLAVAIAKDVSEMNALTYDYLHNREERAAAQWLARHETLGRRLADDRERALEPDLMGALRGDHVDLRSIFQDAVAARASPTTLSRELETRLGGQLSLTSQAMTADAAELAERGQARMTAAQRNADFAAAVLVGTMAAVFAGVSLATGRRLAAAITRLHEGAEIIGAGNLGHRVGTTARDEIGQLSSAFDDMVERRKRAEDALRLVNESLEERVRSRTAELEAANRELEAFAYSVSHDLRAPLRSIDGFSQALLEDYADELDLEGREHLHRVRSATQRLGHLIDDMLTLSRVTRSEMSLETVNLSELVTSISAELRKSQPDRSVDLTIARALAARGDRRLLGIALGNLLDNAWKFTSKHPAARIEFGTTELGGRPAFFVRDDGAGFEMAYAGKLFSPFQRLHGSTEFPGTGIGLATVKRIVQRHGGEVWAEGAVERGATFYFTLPDPGGGASMKGQP